MTTPSIRSFYEWNNSQRKFLFGFNRQLGEKKKILTRVELTDDELFSLFFCFQIKSNLLVVYNKTEHKNYHNDELVIMKTKSNLTVKRYLKMK